MALRPALFLHGFTGSGGSYAQLSADLSDCLVPSCPDLPGHASAPLPARLGREGFEATVDSLAAQLPGPSMVIGYSQGARLALALAVRCPRRVTHLVLESGTAGLQSPEERASRQAEDEARAAMIESQGLDAFIRQWERLPLFSTVPLSAALDARRRSHSATGLAGALRCLGLGVQPDFWPSLPLLQVPTLLLTGGLDPKFTALARRMADQLPRARHVTVPNTGHAVHLEAPQRWAAEVRAFATAPIYPEHPLEELRT